MLEDSLPRFVLLHVDLYQILLGIDPSSFPRSLKIRETLRAFRASKRTKNQRLSSKRGKRSIREFADPF